MSPKTTKPTAATLTIEAASKRDEPALVTSLFARRLAQPLAVLAARLGIGANAVTVAGGLCWMASLAVPPAIGALDAPTPARLRAMWLAAAFLWCAGYLLDVVDGSVARMTGSSCRAGFFLDYVFHLLFKPAFLFSVGLGVAATLDATGASSAVPRVLGLASAPDAQSVLCGVVALALLSIPANGSAATCAAERVLCEEVAAGHVKMLGAAAPALWLGADDVSAPAAAKRGSPARTARVLAAEIVSYYLHAPFFAALVAVDAALSFWPGVDWFPATTAAFLLLSILLVLRIPLRVRREAARLGRPTRKGMACASSIHNRYFRLALVLLFFPAAAAGAVLWFARALPAPFGAVLAPLVAVACVAAESNAAAHVVCQDVGKGKLREDSPADEKRPVLGGSATRRRGLVRHPVAAFAAAVALDAALGACGKPAFATALLGAAFVLSLPPRVRRTFRAFAARGAAPTPG